MFFMTFRACELRSHIRLVELLASVARQAIRVHRGTFDRSFFD